MTLDVPGTLVKHEIRALSLSFALLALVWGPGNAPAISSMEALSLEHGDFWIYEIDGG